MNISYIPSYKKLTPIDIHCILYGHSNIQLVENMFIHCKLMLSVTYNINFLFKKMSTADAAHAI